jgi:acetoin utilization deacetylase AcuC-like enzyme
MSCSRSLKREEAPLRDDVEEQIALAHPQSYIDWVKSVRPGEGEEPVRLDPDTVLSPKSWEPALRAVGAGLAAVDRVLGQELRHRQRLLPGAPLRPSRRERAAHGLLHLQQLSPSPASMPARSTAASASPWSISTCHHGNGTQDIFWSDKNLYFGSTHQMPLYPGTGALSETGVGNVWNAPLRPGDAGDKFKEAFESRSPPRAAQLRPRHRADLGRVRRPQGRSTGKFAVDRARFRLGHGQDCRDRRQACRRRLVSMLEGGYNLAALARSVGVHVKALMEAGA